MRQIFIEIGSQKLIQARRLFQWDYGQEIVFSGLIPDCCIAEFSNGKGQAIDPQQISETCRAVIPDELLETGDDVYCYLVEHDSYVNPTYGTTTHTIYFPVINRPKPETDPETEPEVEAEK